jgi:hypothetical protein
MILTPVQRRLIEEIEGGVEVYYADPPYKLDWSSGNGYSRPYRRSVNRKTLDSLIKCGMVEVCIEGLNRRIKLCSKAD